MAAFVVVQESIENEAVFNQYRAKAPATIEAYGGKFLARGGNLEVMEGDLPYKRLIIIELLPMSPVASTSPASATTQAMTCSLDTRSSSHQAPRPMTKKGWM